MDVAFYEGLKNLGKESIFKFSKIAELKIAKNPQNSIKSKKKLQITTMT